MNESNIIHFENHLNELNDIPDPQVPPKSGYNDDGGGNMNKDKYVTHQELELSNEKLLHHIDNSFSKMDNRLTKTFAEIDKRFDQTSTEMDKRFAEMDKKIDHRFAEMDKRFAEVNLNISEAKNIAKSADSKANWILGILAGVIIAAITALFHFN